MHRLWLRLGATSSVVALLALYVLVLAVGVFLDSPTGAVVLYVAFIAYCFARPHHGLEVFLYVGAPGACGTMLHDLLGISPLWGLLILLVVLPPLREIDRGPVTRHETDGRSPSPQPS
jgi:hypothetical protein